MTAGVYLLHFERLWPGRGRWPADLSLPTHRGWPSGKLRRCGAVVDGRPCRRRLYLRGRGRAAVWCHTPRPAIRQDQVLDMVARVAR